MSEFSDEEWDAICMRCGKCCLTKYEEYNHICFSNQMCEKFDFKTGTCSCYQTRLNDDCLKVDMKLLAEQPELLPETCPYRLLLTGKDLPSYHPLVSGNHNSVHEAQQTVLEIPEVYSKKELQEFMKNHAKGINFSTLSEEEKEKLYTQMKRYNLVYIAVYPIPNKH